MAVSRSELHRHETPEGVLTWVVDIRNPSSSKPTYGLPTAFELDGEPLTVRQGRAIKRRYGIVD